MSRLRAYATAGFMLFVPSTLACAQAGPPPLAPSAPAPPPPPLPAAAAPSPAPVAVTSAQPPARNPSRDQPRVFRFDFTLTGKDGASAAQPTTFSIVVEELSSGEIMLGKNVALTPASPPPGAPGPSLGVARQDVGLKVKADYRMVGEKADELLLNVMMEMSSLDPPGTVRKTVARGNALATPGKSALVLVLDDDRKHYELTVTPQKLR